MTDYTIRVESVARLADDRGFQELADGTYRKIITTNLFEIHAIGTGWKKSNPEELRGITWDALFADGEGRLARLPGASVVSLDLGEGFHLQEGLTANIVLRSPGPFERIRLPYEGELFEDAKLVRREETTSARIGALREAGFGAAEALAVAILTTT